MAAIFERLDCGQPRWRVQIRRKNLPQLNLCFRTREDAQEWVGENEFKYIETPEKYLEWIQKERLNLRRKYELMDCRDPHSS